MIPRQALGVALLAMMLLSAGCSGQSDTSGDIPLTHIPWCSQPTIAFEDDGAVPPADLTIWQQAQPLLGFAPQLPPRLPAGACLASVGGVVRNPVFGGRFTITYALPHGGALSLAETPQQRPIATPECSTGPAAATPITTCQQTRAGLNITLSSSQSADHVQAVLAQLQANVPWEPGK